MFDRQFWNSKLGQAATASILAMTAMIALSTQFQPAPGGFSMIADHAATAELA